ncbi:MAG: hexitol phosphatase HxpB [Flavobacteriaceae bacterium]|nr:hexitol phosphatase HxpB [Flavobacteriaceae bacterium]
MKIKAIIFDMDGILINSEPLWRQAEIETFAKVGLSFTDAMCMQTMGMRTSEVIEYWYKITPWTGKTVKEVENELLQRVTQLILEEGDAMKGVVFALDYFKEKGLKIALASSSATSLIEAVIDKLQIKKYFEFIESAEYLDFGKPHPEIFIKTANKLGVQASECLVIEDSFNGVLAAKAALMKVIAIPDDESKSDKRFVIAEYILNDLEQIKEVIIE